MIKKDGQNILASIKLLKISEAQNTLAIEQAASILEICVGKLNDYVGVSLVGDQRVVLPNSFEFNGDSPRGLIFGKIQSGKTRAMILSSAMATDNGFRIIVCITTDNTELVDQTQKRFINGLPSRITKYKETDFERSVDQAKNILENSNDVIAIICSKNYSVLQKAVNFLNLIDAKKYPTLIFDDEGDQASPDTNTQRRTRTDPDIAPSRINSLIFGSENSLVAAAPLNVFLSVTETPQALILQNSKIRPSFSHNLPVSDAYTGGESFFAEENINENKRIKVVELNEKELLLNNSNENPPEGLEHSILYYFIVAAIAQIKLGENDDGYGYLAHPGRLEIDHTQADLKISFLVSQITQAVKNKNGDYYTKLENIFNELSLDDENINFESIITYLHKTIHLTRRILVNNGSSNSASEHGPYYNLYIGGNSLGRGVTIENLLVTYYLRQSRTSNMDTIYQHARMFGYRRSYLHLTKVYMPEDLYRRFHNTYEEDEELRTIIALHQEELKSIPISVFEGLRPTRKNILDAIRNITVRSGSQLFPLYPIYQDPQASAIRNRIISVLQEIIPNFDSTKSYTGDDYIISLDKGLEIIKTIQTRDMNTNRRINWNSDGMEGIFQKIIQQIGDGRFYVCYKIAPKRKAEGDSKMLHTVLSGTGNDTQPRSLPVLWIIDVGGSVEVGWSGIRFIYPTIVVPRLQNLIFNTT